MQQVADMKACVAVSGTIGERAFFPLEAYIARFDLLGRFYTVACFLVCFPIDALYFQSGFHVFRVYYIHYKHDGCSKLDAYTLQHNRYNQGRYNAMSDRFE